MKLAEALAERAAAKRRIEQLRSRVVASARYQEGEQPAEEAAALLTEVGQVLDAFEVLIRRVNRTNAAAEIDPGVTITDALARRDVLRAPCGSHFGRGRGRRHESGWNGPPIALRAEDARRPIGGAAPSPSRRDRTGSAGTRCTHSARQLGGRSGGVSEQPVWGR
jgi:hypothetical protein